MIWWKTRWPVSCYDEIKSGRVAPVDGESFFEDLRRREIELLKQRSRNDGRGRE
jgi:hypothetical protein